MKLMTRQLGLLGIILLVAACSSTPTWRGMSESDIAAWKELGVDAAGAQFYADAGIAPAAVTDWRDSGISDPESIVAWKNGGFTPADAKPWVEQRIDRDTAIAWSAELFTAEETRAWIDGNFSLSQAKDNRAQGLTPVR